MTTVGDIYGFIDKIAPFSMQEGYDNSGLLIGNRYGRVGKILIALDVTSDVACDAEEQQAELVVTHHPIIFKALKSVDSASPIGVLLRAGASVISAHTNFDSAVMNRILCEKLGLDPCAPLHIENGVECGFICETDGSLTTVGWAAKIRSALGCRVVRYNDMGGCVRKIAVCSGSGGSFLGDAVKLGCDAFITGDIRHDVFIDAYNSKVTVFDATHFFTENIFCEYMRQAIAEAFPEVNVQVAPSNRDILKYEV